MKRWLIILSLCLGLVPRLAEANCTTQAYEPFLGSPGRATGQQALAGFSRLYGATGAAEREVLPHLRAADEGDSAELLHLRWTSLFGASRELMVAEQSRAGCPDLIRSDYDLHAGTFGIGLRQGPLSAYYVTSTVMGVQSGVVERTLGPPTAWIPPGYYAFAAPFTGPWEYESGSLRIGGDFIAGAQLELWDTNLAVGYIGSRGVFTNISQEKLRAFLSAAVANEFSELAYLKTGFDRLSTFRDSLSTIYARKVVFSPPALPTVDDWSLPDVPGLSFWTGHLEQANLIERWVSVKTALAVAPHAFLHDLALSLHTSSFHPDPSLPGYQSDELEMGLSAGTVRVPENRALGQPGSHLVSVRGELRYRGQGDGIGDITLGVGMNDPDVLTQFPSAVNVFNVSFGANFLFL